MAWTVLSKRIKRQIADAVKHYKSSRTDFDRLARELQMNLVEDASLVPFIHSSKYRTKEPDHLRHKLKRYAIAATKKHRPFTITSKSLFTRVPDLAGVRILHLHTKQLAELHPAIMSVLKKYNYTITEGPIAHTWDIESRAFFKSIKIQPRSRESLYTSVHYVLKPADRPDLRVELQVRTLMEEVWGEVSHSVNYPHETKSLSCKEQLRVLARFTSGCTRLVDSIFQSHHEHRARH